MPRRDWKIRIKDIRHAADKILSHAKTLTVEKFKGDEWTQDAVIRNLIIIGEATREVPDDVRGRYPDISWDDMRDMRNVVVHEYFGVDLDIVWETITRDLPEMLRGLDALIRSEGIIVDDAQISGAAQKAAKTPRK